MIKLQGKKLKNIRQTVSIKVIKEPGTQAVFKLKCNLTVI